MKPLSAAEARRVPVVWLSGRASQATALRAAELRVEEVLQGEWADTLARYFTEQTAGAA